MKKPNSLRRRTIFSRISLGYSVAALALMACCASAQTSSDNENSVRQDQVSLRLDAARELQLTATMSPIDFTRYGFHERWDELAKLKAAVPRKTYTANAFDAFLPSKPVMVGDTWEIKEGVIDLIRQLHADATLEMHINPGDAAGRWAMLKAVNERFAEIAFRVHSDFPLQNGFLTFSQFTGRLVIDHVNQEIVFFRMFVPNTTINFDTNWKVNPKSPGSITDAGRCRYVELVSGHSAVVDAIRWAESVPKAETELQLARKFYPAWQINWQPLDHALDLAKRLKKPIHVVSADGPFKDESC